MPPPRARGVVARRRRRYYCFILPALVVIVAVIIFPWLFTVWMSVFDWKIGSDRALRRARQLHEPVHQPRFLEAIVRTFYFTVLAVVAPLVLGTIAALIFHRQFPFRGVLRGVFIMPMMATPVADRAGVDDDVPSAAGRAQLPAVAGRPAAVAMGVLAARS